VYFNLVGSPYRGDKKVVGVFVLPFFVTPLH
jgi:hypothetical protein